MPIVACSNAWWAVIANVPGKDTPASALKIPISCPSGGKSHAWIRYGLPTRTTEA
jgi:hypothetical protein